MMSPHLKKQAGNAEIELIVWIPFTLFFIWFLSDLNLYIYSQNQAQMLASDLVKILSNADNPEFDETSNQKKWLDLAKFQLAQNHLNEELSLYIALTDKDNIQSWQIGECQPSKAARTTSDLFPPTQKHEKSRYLWWVEVCLKPKALLLSQNIMPFVWPENIHANAVFLARGKP